MYPCKIRTENYGWFDSYQIPICHPEQICDQRPRLGRSNVAGFQGSHLPASQMDLSEQVEILMLLLTPPVYTCIPPVSYFCMWIKKTVETNQSRKFEIEMDVKWTD